MTTWHLRLMVMDMELEFHVFACLNRKRNCYPFSTSHNILERAFITILMYMILWE